MSWRICLYWILHIIYDILNVAYYILHIARYILHISHYILHTHTHTCILHIPYTYFILAASVAQAELRKDLDYLRSCVVGKGAGRDGGSAEPSLRTIEQSLSAMQDRCDKTEQLAAATKRDTTAGM
jgi:hypothetical protein